MCAAMYLHRWSSNEGNEDNSVDTVEDPFVLDDTNDSAEIPTYSPRGSEEVSADVEESAQEEVLPEGDQSVETNYFWSRSSQ